MQRGEKLDVLEDKAEQLESQSMDFHKKVYLRFFLYVLRCGGEYGWVGRWVGG
jgi:hypothetical protein